MQSSTFLDFLAPFFGAHDEAQYAASVALKHPSTSDSRVEVVAAADVDAPAAVVPLEVLVRHLRSTKRRSKQLSMQISKLSAPFKFDWQPDWHSIASSGRTQLGASVLPVVADVDEAPDEVTPPAEVASVEVVPAAAVVSTGHPLCFLLLVTQASMHGSILPLIPEYVHTRSQ